MNESDAAERFNSVHARADNVEAPRDRDGAKSLLEPSVTSTDLEAVRHYVATGEGNSTLRQRLELAAAEAMAVATFVAPLTGTAANQEIDTQRRRFQDMLLSRIRSLPLDPSDRVSAVIAARVGQFNRARAWLERSNDAGAATALDALLEVAGLTWELAELVARS